MHFDDLVNNESSLNSFIIPPDWAQGRTAFGGLTAALLVNSIHQSVEKDLPLRAVHFNFVGPVLIDQVIEIEINILRQGRNVTQVMGTIFQDGKTCVVCQASLGISRISKISIKPESSHQMPEAKKGKWIPQIPKVVPKFLRHFELDLKQGKLPFMGSKNHSIGGWMRFKVEPNKVLDTHIVAMIDAWPSSVVQMLKWPVPFSTMSWNLEFLNPLPAISPKSWLAYHAQSRYAADGYAHSEANIWDESGQLIVLSRQLVTVFG